MGTGEWTLMHLLVYFHDFDFRTPYSSVLLVSLSVNTITPIHPYHLPTLNFDFLVSPITRDGKNGMHDIMSILSCQCRYILLCCFFLFYSCVSVWDTWTPKLGPLSCLLFLRVCTLVRPSPGSVLAGSGWVTLTKALALSRDISYMIGQSVPG